LPENRQYIKRTIQHWEAEESIPSDEYSILLVMVFALPDEMREGVIISGSELDRLMSAFKAIGYQVDRRRFLLSAAALALVGRDSFTNWNTERLERLDYVLKNPRRADLGIVGELDARISDLKARYEYTPSTSLLSPVSQCHSHIAFLCDQASDSRVCHALNTLKAQSATLMGQLVWDGSQRRDHTTALAHYDEAIHAARQVHDLIAESYANLRKSFVSLYGKQHSGEGLIFARDAATLAEAGGSQALAGFALLHVAEAHAMLGERHPCEKALGDGESRYSNVRTTDPAIRYYSPDQIGQMRGSCYLFLHDPKRAQPILEATARSLDRKQKLKAIVLGNLALAHIRMVDIDGAVTVLHEAVNLVQITRGGGGLNILFTANRELHTWQEEPFVREVRDRIIDLVAGI